VSDEKRYHGRMNRTIAARPQTFDSPTEGKGTENSFRALHCSLDLLKALVAASAGRRDDAIHAQVFHHLAIMIGTRVRRRM